MRWCRMTVQGKWEPVMLGNKPTKYGLVIQAALNTAVEVRGVQDDWPHPKILLDRQRLLADRLEAGWLDSLLKL